MPGNLIVRPISAQLTHNTELLGKMDPYVIVTMGNHCQKSIVCPNGGKAPIWRDELSMRHSQEDVINVEVWDKDRGSKDDLVGSGAISVSTIHKKGNKTQEWLWLDYKGGSAGKILLEVEYIPDVGTGKAMPSGNMAQPTIPTGGYGQTGFPSQQQYCPQQTYPQQKYPQQQAYPTQQYVQPQQAYSKQQGGFPQQQAYPPQQTGYVQPQQTYPQQQQVYSKPGFPSQGGYPHSGY